MKIYSKDNYKKFGSNALLINLFAKKYRNVLFLLIFFFGIIITTPLNLWNKADEIVRIGLAPLSRIDKRIYYLAKEIYASGDNIALISLRYLKSQLIPIETLNLDISLSKFLKLKSLRNKAIKNNILLRSKDDSFKGNLNYKGENIPVDLRLKGDWTDHLLGDKWSFRIKTKKNTFLKGMKEFSLQHPRTRSYINEYIFHRLLEYENLPYLRYEFIPFYLNGKYLGIYALEEHFHKGVIENSGFREGPILKLSDKNLRNEWLRNEKTSGYVPLSMKNADIAIFNIKKSSKNVLQISQFNLASEMLNKYLKKELKTSDVFDVKTTAKYFALADLMQSVNSNTWYDMRFYFNPIIGRLIPIGYDASPPIKIKERKLSLDKNTLELFEDKEFFKEYLNNLERISKYSYFNNFKNHIYKDLKTELRKLNKSYPHIKFMEKEFYKNQKYIKTRLNPFSPIGIKLSEQYKNNKKFILRAYNKSSIPIKLLNIYVNKIKFASSSDNYLEARKINERFDSKIIEFSNKENQLKINNIGSQVIDIEYKVLGTNKIIREKINILPWANTSKLESNTISRKPSFKAFPRLQVNYKKKEIKITEDIKINKSLIIPSKYKLIINPGINIIFEDEGYLITEGPVFLNGEKNKPISIKSENGGKGIFVLNSGVKSKIKNTIFEKLNPINEVSLNITGAITFYNSDIEIENSIFKDLNAEDGLNIVNSKFKIKNSFFNNLYSDGIDLDFSDGKIFNTTFQNIGNDAIDISGADVSINNVYINQVGDKAISVGESSNLEINNTNLSNGFIGIASKDLSNVLINNLITNNLKICLAAYKKKNEYGPGKIKINSSDKNCMNNYILEKGSSISSDKYKFVINSQNGFYDIYGVNNDS